MIVVADTSGTLGILDRAANMGLVDFRAAFARLDETSFRIAPSVRAFFLNRYP